MANDSRVVASRDEEQPANPSHLAEPTCDISHPANTAVTDIADEQPTEPVLSAPFGEGPPPGSQLALAVVAELAPYLEPEDSRFSPSPGFRGRRLPRSLVSAKQTRVPTNLVIRSATVEDAHEIACLFRVAYGESSHPCKNAQHVFDSICSGAASWRVAVDQGHVVACAALLLYHWNRCWELGRGVTLPEYRGEGLAPKILQECAQAACASSSCDLMLGFPRNRTMLNILRNIQPSLVPVGHDGGINLANGAREYHSIACTLNPNARFRHCIPASHSLAHSEFVHDNIFQPLELSPEEDCYPPVWIVGDSNQHPALASFSFEYDPQCTSRSLEITGCNGKFRNTREAAKTLLLMLASFSDVHHVRLTVLVDKTGFIQHLTDAGFEITSYLPAWYLHQQVRYDCLLLVRRSFSQEPIDHGMRDLIDRFRCGLNQG